MGRAYAELGDLEKAAALHKQDLAISREIGNDGGVANALGDLGNVLVSAGKFSLAVKDHREQLQIAEGLAQPREIASALINLAVSLLHVNSYDEARRCAERAISVYRKMNNQIAAEEEKQRLVKAIQTIEDEQSQADLLLWAQEFTPKTNAD
jgi:tetratricopeptide (TPR) repeat protein